MEIGKKGQFYILIMVFMISVMVGIAYFTTESKQLEQESEIDQEPGLQTIMDNYESELRGSIAGGMYGGDAAYYQEIETALAQQAAEKGYLFESDCDKSVINSYTEKLDCSISLTIGKTTLSASFSETYEVPFQIELYADSDLTDDMNYHHPADTIYYRITAPNTNVVNVSFHYPNGTIAQTTNHTPSDYAAFGTFTAGDSKGQWQATMDDGVLTAGEYFYVQAAIVTVNTFDSNWVPQFTFGRGETVNYRVEVDPAANVYVDITAEGQDRDYDWWSDGSAALHEGSFVVKPTEFAGSLTITAVEQTYFEESSAEILILFQPFGAFIPIGLVTEWPPEDAFRSACGYEEWYANDSTVYSDVPFDIKHTPAVVRVDNEKKVIDAPNVYADKIHILEARCDDC